MAQDRGKRRGLANLMTCTLLLLFSVLGFAAGCSSYGEVAEDESVGSQSQAQFACTCPQDNPCATFSCVGDKCVAAVKIREGEPCGGKILGYTGVCHLNLCCPGCVVTNKLGPPECARAEGMANAQCGATGTTCENCTLDKCQIPACDGRSCNLKPVDEGGACVGTSGFCTKGACCKGCVDGSGVCQPGNTLTQCGVGENALVRCEDCSDEKPCTADACVAGQCTAPAVAPGTSCDDGNVCNGVSECSGTSCQAGTALDCDDDNPCTVDSCDGKEGCKHEPAVGAECSDGDPCTTGEKCDAKAVCAGGVVNKCNDNKTCTTDSCKGGACVNTPVEAGTTCNDGNSCTEVDSCDADGKCVGTGGPACDDNNPCTKNSCAADICSNPFESASTPCVFDKCTQNSHCAGTTGACVAGTPIDCDDANPCTADSCNPTQGCVNTPVTTVMECADGDAVHRHGQVRGRGLRRHADGLFGARRLPRARHLRSSHGPVRRSTRRKRQRVPRRCVRGGRLRSRCRPGRRGRRWCIRRRGGCQRRRTNWRGRPSAWRRRRKRRPQARAAARPSRSTAPSCVTQAVAPAGPLATGRFRVVCSSRAWPCWQQPAGAAPPILARFEEPYGAVFSRPAEPQSSIE